MAVSTVSSIDSDVWQLISTSTISTSTATVTFSGLGGVWKKLAIAWSITASTGNCIPYIQFNGDSTAGNYAGSAILIDGANVVYGVNTSIYMGAHSRSDHYGYVEFIDCDQTSPKYASKYASISAPSWNGVYLGTSAISSLVFGASSNAFSTGTVKLYGIAS